MVTEKNTSSTSNLSDSVTNPRGVAVASLAAGIVAVIVSWIPFIALPFAIGAIIMGVIGIKKKVNIGWAIGGLTTGTIGLLVCIVSTALLFTTIARLN